MGIAWRVSPQRIDPLSWFTRPLVPLAFASIILGYSTFSITTTWSQLAFPMLDLLAVLLLVLACLMVQSSIGPFSRAFGVAQSIPPLVLGTAALCLSTWANLESTLQPQFWWAPVGVGCLIAALGPYSSVRRVIVYGGGLSVLTGVLTFIAFAGPAPTWPGISLAVIGISSPLTGTLATATFCYVMVSRTQSLLSWAGTVIPPSQVGATQAANRVERTTVARLGIRVAPFLEGIAESGVVTDADRALAGQLARRLRSDIVERVNRSWLDLVAVNGRIVVVDPERRADQMNGAQRTALRGLLLAALRIPTTDAGSLFIELRGQPDGSTAVALSLDLELPEGRRDVMLAPYYLALQTTVTDVSWNPARDLLRFEVPGQSKPDPRST